MKGLLAVLSALAADRSDQSQKNLGAQQIGRVLCVHDWDSLMDVIGLIGSSLKPLPRHTF